jgi:hypothetical protein
MTAGQPYPNDANPELAVNRGQGGSPRGAAARRTRKSSRVLLCPDAGQRTRTGSTIMPTWPRSCDVNHFVRGLLELHYQY